MTKDLIVEVDHELPITEKLKIVSSHLDAHQIRILDGVRSIELEPSMELKNITILNGKQIFVYREIGGGRFNWDL